MQFKLSTTVTSSYRHLAIVFLVMTIILTVVRGVYHDIFKERYLSYLAPSVAPFGILFFLFMIRLVKILGVRKELIKFILALLILAIILRGVTVLVIEDPLIALIFSLLSSTMLLVMQMIAVYYMCVNLFLDENPIKEKLWASVCVYFMLGATFGTVYSIVILFSPGALGVSINSPAEIYILGLVYSFNVLSGLDPVYEHASETIRMTAVLESIFAMLFMVILIGRLLGNKD